MRRFGSRTVVDDVSLRILPGQVTCLLGPSGCGKSTTLRMIAGIEIPDSGEIWVDGRMVCDGASTTAPENRSIGLMFQDFALFPHLTVEQNVVFGLTGPVAAQRKRAGDLLDRVGLRRHLESYPHALSGGEQQRVALARALAPQPRILLMDEPFSGLDNRLRDGIRDETLALLKEEDTAVLLVTHEPEEAMRMADEIALMRDGRIIQSGAPYNLFTAPYDKQAMSFFSDINVIESQVNGSLAETPFGQFLSPGLPDGT
ncbi:MAG: Fe3+/spermidine/putrescine ABC transporter ATP-binding protein, partial [Marinovum sp.]|nr:Fe3+/spermidine/putrescine ABC transporter ATP-binding protein [Marinovum sp.]